MWRPILKASKLTLALLAILLLTPVASATAIAPTSIQVSGISYTDPYDRVLSLTYHGIEVARYITPLHRSATLPNSFAWDVRLPFGANSLSTAFLIGPYSADAAWNISVSETSGSGAQVFSVIPDHRALTETAISFTIPFPGRVYILASGHALCESEDNLNAYIDSNKVGHVFNWHPQSLMGGDIPGAPIPYITAYLDAGPHTLVFHSCYFTGPYYPVGYVDVSAFVVYAPMRWT